MNSARANSSLSTSLEAGARSLRQLILVLMTTTTVLAADSSPLWKVLPEPKWVKPVEVTVPGDIPTRDLQNGVFHLLMDSQIRDEPTSFYYHVARLLVDAAGVQSGSRIQISLDPAYEKLAIHRLNILRDGQTLDRLAEVEVRELTREPGLESHVLNGRVTFVIDVKDTRAGDVLDYSFSVAGENPVYAGHFGNTWFVGSDEPIAEQRLRVVVAGGRALRFRTFGLDEPRDFAAKNERQWIWKNPIPIDAEESTPGWAVVWPFVQASDMSSWADVVDWALPMYSFEQELPPELEARILEWRSLATDELRLLAALRWTQKEVRYLGQMMGVHSHAPRPAKTVCEQKFGDCKEKTVLLGTVLQRMGIKSFPILVSSRMRRGIADLLPSVDAFDHVILGIEWDGRVLFVDPTRDEQRGGLEELGLGSFDLGLAIRPGERDLMAISPPPAARRVTEVDEVFTLDSLKSGGRLTVKTVVKGGAAEFLRASILDSGSRNTEKLYQDYYARFFPGITVAERLRVDETPGRNELKLTEEYRIPQAFQKDESGDGTLELPASDLLTFITAPVATERKFPLEISHPVSYKQRTTVLLPEGFSVQAKHVDIDNDFFRLQVDSAPGPQRFEITRSYESKSESVPPERFGEWREAVRKARDACIQSFTDSSEPATPEPVAFISSFNLLTLVAALVGIGGALVTIASAWWRAAKLSRCILPPSLDHPNLAGIQGWLILPAIGLPLTLIGSVIPSTMSFGRLFTWPVQEMFAALGIGGAVALLVHFTLGVWFIGLVAAALVFFFRKSQLAPLLVAAVFLVSIVICSLELVLSAAAPNALASGNKPPAVEFALALFKAAIWVPYFHLSRRVKATFRW